MDPPRTFEFPLAPLRSTRVPTAATRNMRTRVREPLVELLGSGLSLPHMQVLTAGDSLWAK
jgi:hypothetical protein